MPERPMKSIFEEEVPAGVVKDIEQAREMAEVEDETRTRAGSFVKEGGQKRTAEQIIKQGEIRAEIVGHEREKEKGEFEKAVLAAEMLSRGTFEKQEINISDPKLLHRFLSIIGVNQEKVRAEATLWYKRNPVSKFFRDPWLVLPTNIQGVELGFLKDGGIYLNT